MILTVEETKQFFRENKELIKGLTVRFRYQAGKFTQTTGSQKLRETGEMILDLAHYTEHFSFGQAWRKNSNKPRGEYDYVPDTKGEFIEQLKSGDLTGFEMSPYKFMTHAEKMGAGHYGSLD